MENLVALSLFNSPCWPGWVSGLVGLPPGGEDGDDDDAEEEEVDEHEEEDGQVEEQGGSSSTPRYKTLASHVQENTGMTETSSHLSPILWTSL